MSSWFGGPSPSHRTPSHHGGESSSTTTRRRESSPKGYFVRPKSPTRRTSSPKGYFVRPKSPSRQGSQHGGGGGGSHHGSYIEVERGASERGLLEGGISSIFGGGGRDGRDSRDARDGRDYSAARGFGLGGLFSSTGRGSSSYYKRRPRDGYISRLVNTIRRIFRDLVRYARNNPVKLFMLVVMPLLTGGALHKILQSMGVRLPPGLSRMMGGGRGGYERESSAAAGGMDLGQVMNVAKMFL